MDTRLAIYRSSRERWGAASTRDRKEWPDSRRVGVKPMVCGCSKISRQNNLMFYDRRTCSPHRRTTFKSHDLRRIRIKSIDVCFPSLLTRKNRPERKPPHVVQPRSMFNAATQAASQALYSSSGCFSLVGNRSSDRPDWLRGRTGPERVRSYDRS